MVERRLFGEVRGRTVGIDRAVVLGLAPHGLLAVLCLAELVAILVINGGRFIYSLDDPYIHLALAEQLARAGHYGINPGEAASPSSSILWPFLLVPLIWLGLGEAGPLILNLLAAFACLVLVGQIVDRVLPAREPGASLSTAHVLQRATLVGLAIPSLNIVGLVFIGMEHLLQVDLALLAVLGMISTDHRTVPWAMPTAIILGPLVRYEHLAISAVALLMMAWYGHWRRAFAAAGVLALLMIGFSAFLVSIGQDVLPSAVLIKTDVGAAHPIVGRLHYLVQELRDYRIIPVFLLMAVWLAYRFCISRLQDRDGVLALAALAIIGAHIVAGRFDWYSRYEPYLVGLAMSLLLFVYRMPLRTWLVALQRAPRHANGVAMICLCATACLVFSTYVLNGWARTPLASHSIYLQQYQMRRFFDDFYRAPVAVNDIGLIGLEAPAYMLDLWGLASSDARKARIAGTPDWMDRLTRAHGVKLAMIYANKDWLGGAVPRSWIKVGRLITDISFGTVGAFQVDFFAMDASGLEQIRAALERFAPTLPPGARFQPIQPAS